MQELNPHRKTITNIESGTNTLTTCATETPTLIKEIITGEFVQDRQLNKTAIAVLKAYEKILCSKYRPKKSPCDCPNGVVGKGVDFIFKIWMLALI